MFVIENKAFRYGLDEKANCALVEHLGHESVHEAAGIWKLIYAVPGTERVEACVWSDDQNPDISQEGNQLVVHYPTLLADGKNTLNVDLTVYLDMKEDALFANAKIVNNDPAIEVMEFQLTPVSGVRSLNGDPENDYIAWPNTMGRKVRNPAFRDLSTFAGFRKYERHDQYHTDMDALYQDARGSMQWYDWYNENEGLYFASRDLTRESLCLHAERDTKKNILRFGFIQYPMIKAGEEYVTSPIEVAAHEGDWHAGSKRYRKWMNEEAGYVPPKISDWALNSTGFLRVILKQHHCECNWTYDDIPALWDECEAAGFDTLYLLGWEKGGFARMWPDFEVDEGSLGGSAKLKAGIDYVHSRGGKVLMFLSYLLIDHKSKFYLEEGGDRAVVKSIWDEDVPFSETYCGEGTYRKIGNPPMPMFLACPESPIWHEKMKDVARVCLEAGADGVLYDLGAKPPTFCYATDHGHAKPTQAYCHKAERFADLRRFVKSYGEDKIILMEHVMDIYNQQMDLTQPNNTQPEPRLRNPKTAASSNKDDLLLGEMYRYTFPEVAFTNRECGEDENSYKAMAGYSFVMGLRFDMTIFRCCGSFKDIPNYTAYLTKLNALYRKHAKHLLRGKFVDTDGFAASDEYVIAKGYVAQDGTMAVALWNPTGDDRKVTITHEGKTVDVTVEAEGVAVVEV